MQDRAGFWRVTIVRYSLTVDLPDNARVAIQIKRSITCTQAWLRFSNEARLYAHRMTKPELDAIGSAIRGDMWRPSRQGAPMARCHADIGKDSPVLFQGAAGGYFVAIHTTDGPIDNEIRFSDAAGVPSYEFV